MREDVNMQDLPFPKKLNLRWILLTLSFIEGIWLTVNMLFSALDAEEMLHNSVMRLDYYRYGQDTDPTHLLFAWLAIVTRGWVLMAAIGFAYAVFKRGHGYRPLIEIYQVMNALTILCAVGSWTILAAKPAVIGPYLLQNDTVQALDIIFDLILPIGTTYLGEVFRQNMKKREKKAKFAIDQANLRGRQG